MTLAERAVASATAPKILFTPDVSARLGVPIATLRWWRHASRGPKSFKLGARKVAYLESDVDAWFAEQYAAAQGDEVEKSA